jgi:hypothetical protein
VPPYAETVSYIRRVKRGYEKSKAGLSLEVAPGPSDKKIIPSLAPTPSKDVAALQLNLSN